MSIRILFAAVLSAVALFFWGFAYWTILLGPDRMAHRMDDMQAEMVAKTLRANLTESGAYLYPMAPKDAGDEAAMNEFTQRHQEGPVFLMYYKTHGGNPMEPAILAQGFFHMLICTLLAGIFLSTVASAMCCYGARVAFVFALGLFAEVWVELGKPIWWMEPWSFAGYSLVYGAVGWLIAGIIIGAIVKTPRPAPQE